MRNNKFTLYWFFTSIWLVIGLNLYEVSVHMLRANQIFGAYPGGYDFKVFIAPFFLLTFEGFMWFKYFRWLIQPTRIFAGIVGLYILLMVILVNLLVADLYERDVSDVYLWLYAYAGLGHLIFAIFGKENNYL